MCIRDRTRTSDSCLETLLYSEQQTTSAPLRRQQPPLCEAPVAPRAPEQTVNSYYQQFADDNCDQRSLCVQSVAPGLVSSSGGTNGACSVLQSLGVCTELVSAIQRTATQCSVAESSDQVIQLMSCLSDVLTHCHQQQQPGQSVNVDQCMSAIGQLLPAADRQMMMMMMMTGAPQQQQHQDFVVVVVVQFLISLLQLLRPLLNSHALLHQLRE